MKPALGMGMKYQLCKTYPCPYFDSGLVNSLWSSDQIWHHKTSSTLVLMCDGTKLLPQVDLITEMHLHSPKAILQKKHRSLTLVWELLIYISFKSSTGK